MVKDLYVDDILLDMSGGLSSNIILIRAETTTLQFHFADACIQSNVQHASKNLDWTCDTSSTWPEHLVSLTRLLVLEV